MSFDALMSLLSITHLPGVEVVVTQGTATFKGDDVESIDGQVDVTVITGSSALIH
jgi:hypothetical protein